MSIGRAGPRDDRALAALLQDAARGRFPAPDGSVEVVGPPAGAAMAVVAFTAHHVVAADIAPDWVRGRLPDGDLLAPISARFLAALGGSSAPGRRRRRRAGRLGTRGRGRPDRGLLSRPSAGREGVRAPQRRARLRGCGRRRGRRPGPGARAPHGGVGRGRPEGRGRASARARSSRRGGSSTRTRCVRAGRARERGLAARLPTSRLRADRQRGALLLGRTLGRRWRSAGRRSRMSARAAMSRSATMTPSPSGACASTVPHGSTIMLCP